MKRLLVPENRINPGNFNGTIFLDDCHHTFSLSERQPALALLNSGADPDSYYPSSGHEYSVFGPKAFAGNAPLPPSLAARCIPITLIRKKPSDPVSRFDPESAHAAAVKLVSELTLWINRNRQKLEDAASTSPPGIPPGHTPREQACAEALVHIADLIGGSWPEKARNAVSAIFRLAEGTTAVELLCDLRAAFYIKGDPEFLYTKDIIATLRQLDHRPWSAWSPSAGKKLGSLLGPLGIRSRSLQRGSETSFRGYLIEAFKDAWERYTPPITVSRVTKNSSAGDSAG